MRQTISLFLLDSIQLEYTIWDEFFGTNSMTNGIVQHTTKKNDESSTCCCDLNEWKWMNEWHVENVDKFHIMWTLPNNCSKNICVFSVYVKHHFDWSIDSDKREYLSAIVYFGGIFQKGHKRRKLLDELIERPQITVSIHFASNAMFIPSLLSHNPNLPQWLIFMAVSLFPHSSFLFILVRIIFVMVWLALLFSTSFHSGLFAKPQQFNLQIA